VDPKAAFETEEALPGVVREQADEEDTDVEKVAVDILNDEREGFFAAIFFARLADGAGGRVGPEGLVVGAAIVVASEAEAAGRPQDQHGAGDKGGEPRGSRAEPGRLAGCGAEEDRRIERRKIRAVAVMDALESGPGGINDESGQSEEGEQGLQPPQIAPRGLAEAPALERDVDGRYQIGIITLAGEVLAVGLGCLGPLGSQFPIVGWEVIVELQLEIRRLADDP
jgi:hypothetical protein